MRCPNCNKFVGLEMGEPEWSQSLDITEEGEVSGEVRIARNCAECGDEMKEASFEIEESFDLEDHQGAGHEVELVSEEPDLDTIEDSGGRYAKSYYGASCSIKVNCSCGVEIESIEWSEKTPASYMEEMC